MNDVRQKQNRMHKLLMVPENSESELLCWKATQNCWTFPSLSGITFSRMGIRIQSNWTIRYSGNDRWCLFGLGFRWVFDSTSDGQFGFLTSPYWHKSIPKLCSDWHVTIQNVYNMFDIGIKLNTLCDINLSKIIYIHCISVYVELQIIVLI